MKLNTLTLKQYLDGIEEKQFTTEEVVEDVMDVIECRKKLENFKLESMN